MKTDLKQKSASVPLKVSFLAIASYFFLTLASMSFFPGGSILSENAEQYRFFENYFSDLGRITTHSGKPNTTSAILFAASLVLVGCGCIIIFVRAPGIIEKKVPRSRVLHALKVSGVMTGVACTGIAFTPWDILYLPHIICVYIFAVSFLFNCILYAIILFRNPAVPRGYVILQVVYGLALSIYILLLFSAPDQRSQEGIKILAVSQKIIVYTGILCLLIQNIGVLRILHRARYGSNEIYPQADGEEF